MNFIGRELGLIVGIIRHWPDILNKIAASADARP
jgi:hypothetical protein